MKTVESIARDCRELSGNEKLWLLEALWDELARDGGEDFESPAWHERALHEAEADRAAGRNPAIDWQEAKEQLRSES